MYQCINVLLSATSSEVFTAQVHYGCNKQQMYERIRRRGSFDYLYHRRLMCFCQHYDASNSRSNIIFFFINMRRLAFQHFLCLDVEKR